MTDRAQVEAGLTWQELFDRTAKALGCLPSSFTDGNGHVVGKARGLMEEIAQLRASLTATQAKVGAMEMERDAYRKAKQENDDRFMQERDQALARAEEVRAALLAVQQPDFYPHTESDVEMVKALNERAIMWQEHWNEAKDKLAEAEGRVVELTKALEMVEWLDVVTMPGVVPNVDKYIDRDKIREHIRAALGRGAGEERS